MVLLVRILISKSGFKDEVLAVNKRIFILYIEARSSTRELVEVLNSIY
jgi:hypothetical protein